MGNELYNRSVSYSNPFFENLFLPVMINLTESDREKGSMFLVMSLKAQINALKLMMNTEYLIFMNITLYNEVIKKFISPQCSQYVLVALTRGGMVHTHKLLWEFLITKREWLCNKEQNTLKQKEQSEKERLLKLQKPAGQQVDERVDERVDFRMTSAVPETVQSILKDTLHPEAFKKTDEGKHKKKHGSKSNSNKKHKSGNKQNNQQLLPAQVPIAIPAQVPITMPTLFPQPPSANANPALQNPMVSMPSGFTNQGSSVQYIAIPAGHIPPFTYSEFSRGGGNFHRGSNNGRNSRGRGRRGRGNFARSQGENDAYSMDVAPFNIFKNQIIPVGLHNLSKSFRPNLTTTRVFALGTKFIPVWKRMDIKKPFAKFEDFRRRMSNKVYFAETTPGMFVKQKFSHQK